MCLVTSPAASREANTGNTRAECYTEDTYECGDIRISACAQCVCGHNTFSYKDYKTKYDRICCPAPGEECHTNDKGDGVCNNGILIDIYQSCDYAHFSCDNRTVNQYEMCHGYGLCQDGTDLEQCSALGCDPGRDESLCEDVTNANSAHRECFDWRKGNDGSYDCLNRRDEKIVTRDTSVRIDFSELKKCSDYEGNMDMDIDGLTCGPGSNCINNFDWCREEKSRSCETETSSFNTASKEICSNAIFWREKNITCDFLMDGIIYQGVRCGGNKQHCIWPHLFLFVTSLVPNLPNDTSPYRYSLVPRRCEDRSDQVFRVGLTCWDIALEHMKTYCDTFCTPELIKRYGKKTCSEKCGDPRAWLSNQTSSYYIDPHLCQASCQEPGLHCVACSNEKYPRCLKNNVPVCYHPDLWCDGHPTCDNTQDEPITDYKCYQTLLRKGEVKKRWCYLSNLSRIYYSSFNH